MIRDNACPDRVIVPSVLIVSLKGPSPTRHEVAQTNFVIPGMAMSYAPLSLGFGGGSMSHPYRSNSTECSEFMACSHVSVAMIR